MLESQRNWIKNNPDRVKAIKQRYLANHPTKQKEYDSKPERKRQARNNWLKRKYGITLEEFEKVFKQQGECCAICLTKNEKLWAVDHNHTTKVFRGILCQKCNRGLGHFNDNPLLVSYALDYLREHI